MSEPHPLLSRVESGDEFYFVHSYFTRPAKAEDVLWCDRLWRAQFCSMLGHKNLFATQFHLEKSGKKGLSILAEFGVWDGCV